jgi:hypothetical protein
MPRTTTANGKTSTGRTKRTASKRKNAGKPADGGVRAAYRPRQVGNADVQRFLDALESPTRRDDAFVLDEMFQRISRAKPRLAGSIVGYGSYTYTLANGKRSQSMRIGFSPRKQSLVVYIMPGFADPAALQRLGKHKAGRSCLYITRLADIDAKVLEQLARSAWDVMAERYPD